MKRRTLSKPEPPRGLAATRPEAWNIYLASIGFRVKGRLRVSRRQELERSQTRAAAGRTPSPPLETPSPYWQRVRSVADSRGCTLEAARKIVERERSLAER